MPDQVLPDRRIADVLQDLATVCRDSQEGYRTAADQTSDGELKSLFEECAQRRGREADELDKLIRDHGGEPASRSGSMAGQAHRVFVALRAALSRSDRAAALYEVARGESYAEAAFDRAKRARLDGTARDTVMRLHDSVKQSRDKFRRMAEAEGGTAWGFAGAFPAGQRALDNATHYVSERVGEKPMTSSLVALGLGFVVGALTMMMTRPSRDGGSSSRRGARAQRYGGSRHEADRPTVGVGG